VWRTLAATFTHLTPAYLLPCLSNAWHLLPPYIAQHRPLPRPSQEDALRRLRCPHNSTPGSPTIARDLHTRLYRHRQHRQSTSHAAMSRSIYYDTRDHLDNVHDVSHGCRISYYDDFEDSQTVAASSVPPAGPWSPYNTRVRAVAANLLAQADRKAARNRLSFSLRNLDLVFGHTRAQQS
jgi:hypothetical protein